MKNLRSFAIVDYLKEKKYCSLAELMDAFHVSSATIYRDISALVERNVVQRVRGGVAFIDNTGARGGRQGVAASNFEERAERHRGAKERIARKARAYITEGDILFLDASTTVAHLAEELVRMPPLTTLTIITNSVGIMQNFHRFPSHYVLIGLGGGYDAQLNAFLGQATLRELERLAITKAFVSAFGVDERNATTHHENQAGLLSRVLEMASHRYLLADASKFGRTGLYKLAPRGLFDAIIRE